MTLSDPQVYRNIIGCLMKKPTLRLEYDFQSDDFDLKIYQGIFAVISNLIANGFNSTFNEINLDLEINSIASPSFLAMYERMNGVEILKDCLLVSDLENFDYYFGNMKKNALLRELRANGYTIDHFFVEASESFTKNEAKAIENYNNATVESILSFYEAKQNAISAKFLTEGKNATEASLGIDALLKDLAASPNVGPDLEGQLFSHCCRGARRGCFYLKSASTSTGKTRTAVFDACRIAYPIRYSIDRGCFVYDAEEDGTLRAPRKTLFIVTEMDKEELQTIILAYLSKVNEDHILTSSYELGEKERVAAAKAIMEMFKGNFFITTISDPDLTNIEATIKKFAVIDGVEYVFD